MWEEVPDELWEEIFAYLGMDHQRRPAPVSLVCKRFLAISDDASPLALFSRFSLVKTVLRSRLVHHAARPIQPPPPIPPPILPTRFPSGRHTMRKTLKSLKCTRFLVVLADSFPYLQELGIEGSGRINRPRFGTRHVTDQGIRAISLQLESLLSLNACSQKHLTPPPFQYLSSDCPLICDLHASFSDDCPVGLIGYVVTSF